MKDPLLKVENLSRHFIIKNNLFSPGKTIQAVKNVSFALNRGETLGLVGESGSGKSTLGYLVMCLLEANEGRIIFNGTDITSLKELERRKIRKDLQIIFQYTNAVLDPLMTIGELIKEALIIHSIVDRKSLDREVDRLLDMVGLPPNEKGKFPHQLSGGQNQRIIIARAIAVRPKLIICDEPVSALDVSIQGQILNLLSDLQKELNLTYLFISHDLKVVGHLCNRVAVMYQGEIVECGERDQVLYSPQHTYTRALLNSGLIPS